MCYIINEKIFNTNNLLKKITFFFTKKIKITKTTVGKKSYNIKVVSVVFNEQSLNKRTIKRLKKKVSAQKVLLQINSNLSNILSEAGLNIVYRRGFFKKYFNKMTLQLLKSMDLEPEKLKTYIVADECRQLDRNFLSELCLLSNQICICIDENIDDLCEEIYDNLGASVIKARISDLSNKNDVYFIYSSDINIIKKFKKTSADKLIFSYNDFNEYSTKNKTVIDGVNFDVSPAISEKLLFQYDAASLITAMDEDEKLDITDISLKCFTSCNLEVSGGRLVKMKLLDS